MADKIDKKQMEDLQFTEKLEQIRQYAKVYADVLQLVDLDTSTTKSWTVFSKEKLRGFLKNPYSANSEDGLRNLAKFLYTLSFPFRRIVGYFASIPELNTYKINLDFSLSEENNEESLLKDYENACRLVRRMNLSINIFKLLIIAWREGVVYFQPYQDENGNMLLMPLDSKYCKISSVGYNNLFNVAFDFTFFNGQNSFYLDVWDSEYQKKYNAYSKDSKLRWQQLDTAHAIKMDISDVGLNISVFAGLFEPIIDLIDSQSLKSVKDTLDIYKLLVMKIPMLDGKGPDEMALNLETAKEFYNKAIQDLPEEVGLILSPMDIDSIAFDSTSANDIDAISDSYQNLMEETGISQIFDSSKLTGSKSVEMSMLSDALTAMKGIMPQIEAFVNERIQMEYPNSAAYIKFIDVTTYTRESRIKSVKDAASSGLPVKLEWMALMGYDPLEAMSSDWLERKLGLAVDKWINPVKTSYTQSGDSETGGAPEKDDTDLTDEGAETKDKNKNK